MKESEFEKLLIEEFGDALLDSELKNEWDKNLELFIEEFNFERLYKYCIIYLEFFKRAYVGNKDSFKILTHFQIETIAENLILVIDLFKYERAKEYTNYIDELNSKLFSYNISKTHFEEYSLLDNDAIQDIAEDNGCIEYAMYFLDKSLFRYKILAKIFNGNSISKEEIEKVGKFAPGKKATKINIKHYEMIFEQNKKKKKVTGKDNFKEATFIVARKIGYDKEIEQKQLYKRFYKFKTNNKLESLKDFESYKKSLLYVK